MSSAAYLSADNINNITITILADNINHAINTDNINHAINTDNINHAINTVISDNISHPKVDVWAGKNICEYLDNVTDTILPVICGLDLYLPPFLFIIGLISNTLVVLVMRSRFFRALSTSLYMSVNAVTDAGSILLALPAHYIFVNAPHVFESARGAHAMCSFFNVIGWGSSDLGILITVAMTTERAIAIKYPLKAHKLCTPRRAKAVVAGLALFELIKVSHFIAKSRVVSDTSSRLCDVDRRDAGYMTFYLNVWPWFHFSVLFLSYVIVMAGNVVLFLNIRRSYQSDTIDGVGRKSCGGNPNMSIKNRQVSLMLLIDSIGLILCTLPYSVIGILMASNTLNLDSPGGKNLTFAVTFYLLYLNRCLNFFLYCITGSRFRSALREILTPSSRSSALNRSATRHARTLSVSRCSRDQHVSDSNSKSYDRDVSGSHSLEVCASIAVQTTGDHLPLPGALALAIFLTSSSAEFQLENLTTDVIITRL